MEVKSILYKEATNNGTVEYFSREYTDITCKTIRETKRILSKSDSFDTNTSRTSTDGGKTWSDWVVDSDEKDAARNQGAHVLEYGPGARVYNPIHGHFIATSYQAIHIDGYAAASGKGWNGDSSGRPIHSYITVSDDNGKELYSELLKYEDGGDFNPNNWIDPSFIHKNECITSGGNIEILDNGDIIFPAELPMRKACEILGKDINEIFPSQPDGVNGAILFRGTWNGERYELTHSRPIIINDYMSSRGLSEPITVNLKNGKIIMILRGSNFRFKNFNSRIAPGTPPVKFYCVSEDGGKTFSDLMPWHYDNGEIFYSPASISKLFVDERTGKKYFIGNICNHTGYGNFPRSTLAIVEIDENFGTAKKDTLTIIDERRENEPYQIQLSNFFLFFNKETQKLEIDLPKVGQFFIQSDPTTTPFKGEAWRYEISFDE